MHPGSWRLQHFPPTQLLECWQPGLNPSDKRSQRILHCVIRPAQTDPEEKLVYTDTWASPTNCPNQITLQWSSQTTSSTPMPRVGKQPSSHPRWNVTYHHWLQRTKEELWQERESAKQANRRWVTWRKTVTPWGKANLKIGRENFEK